MNTEGKTLKQRAVHEFEEFIWISLYLFVFFSMFLLYKSVILREQGVDYVGHGVAVINALVLAKFMLAARAFHPGHRTDKAPLIYPTLLKSAIFAIFLIVCKILEDVVVGYFHGNSLGESIADFGGGGWRPILIFTVILFVALIPLTAFGELERVVGAKELRGLFLRERDASKTLGK